MPLIQPDTPLVTRVVASPNLDTRRDEAVPDILLLHYTGMPEAEAAVQRLCDPQSAVSCHCLVDEAGCVVQMVAEADRAWHAGLSSWEDETDVNSRSIGIEIANPGHEHGYRPYPDAQIQAVIALAQDICARHGIAPEHVLAHSDVAPRRKLDPGELFPWDRLAGAGVGHWVEPAPVDRGGYTFFEGDEGEPVDAVQSLFAMYGYGIEITGTFDANTCAVVTAFQRHFRPARVDGQADPSTVATLRTLLAALPER